MRHRSSPARVFRAGRQGWLGLALLMGLSSCAETTREAPAPQELLRVPANFPALPATPDNVLTANGIALGKQLFYDPALSSNGRVSCASCHHPELAFSDGMALTSVGVSGQALRRHSPALINLAWATNGVFWDGGSRNLESQALGPLTSPDEQAHDLALLARQLQANPAYQQPFARAFPGEAVNYSTVARALAQFERTLISGDSPYDQAVRGEGPALTTQEQNGRLLYAQHCADCHATDLFTDQQYHNNGLDTSFSPDHDQEAWGRGRITFDPLDMGKYRTPTLRNVALTAPYMHDGRLPTLEAVVQHYASGIVASPTLDSRLPVGGLRLTALEQTQLVAFLHTLTDRPFTTNPAYRP